MKIHTLLLLTVIVSFASCKEPKKYEMNNMMPLPVDISDYINSEEFEPDSCRKRLNRIKRVKPMVMDESYETMLQIKLKKWRDNYNRWLKENKRDTIYFTIESLYKKTKYQYSYIITDKPIDVYRTDTPLKVNDVENMRFYIQLDEKGEFVSDYNENNFVDTSCDTENSEFQDVYSEEEPDIASTEQKYIPNQEIVHNWKLLNTEDFEVKYPKNWKQENDYVMYQWGADSYWVFDSPQNRKEIDNAKEYNRKNGTDAGGEGFYNSLLIEKFKDIETFKKNFYLEGNTLKEILSENNQKFGNVHLFNWNGNIAYEASWSWSYGSMYAVLCEYNNAIYFLSFGSLTESPQPSSSEYNLLGTFQFKKNQSKT